MEFCKLGVEKIHDAKAHVDVGKRGLRENRENFRIPIYHALSHQSGASSEFEVIDKLIGDMVRLIG